MHDNDSPICSTSQSMWVEVCDKFRRHIIKNMSKKPGLDLKTLGGLIELSSQVMQLEVWANAFDEVCESKKAIHQRKSSKFE